MLVTFKASGNLSCGHGHLFEKISSEKNATNTAGLKRTQVSFPPRSSEDERWFNCAWRWYWTFLWARILVAGPWNGCKWESLTRGDGAEARCDQGHQAPSTRPLPAVFIVSIPATCDLMQLQGQNNSLHFSKDYTWTLVPKPGRAVLHPC